MEIRGPFRNLKPITLASSSPRRQRLLASLGIFFEVIPSNVKEETSAPPGFKFENVAIQNAVKKAEAVKKKAIRGIVLSADTIVVLENKIIGKPQDKSDGLKMLKSLSGEEHFVITGCCLLDLENKTKEVFSVKSIVKIAKFSDSVLNAYLNTSEGFDKAGCYAVQGVGAFLVEWIKGSYTNVVGLPLKETVDALLKMEAITIEM